MESPGMWENFVSRLRVGNMVQVTGFRRRTTQTKLQPQMFTVRGKQFQIRQYSPNYEGVKNSVSMEI